MLGSINLSADGPPVSRDQRKKHVVDGQQRIVTLSLLFGAARSRFLAAGDGQYAGLAEHIKKLLLQVGLGGVGWGTASRGGQRQCKSRSCCCSLHKDEDA